MRLRLTGETVTPVRDSRAWQRRANLGEIRAASATIGGELVILVDVSLSDADAERAVLELRGGLAVQT